LHWQSFLIAGVGWYYSRPADPSLPMSRAVDSAARAFAERATGRMIFAQGTVARVLSDDRNGSPHQRFVVRTASGQTLLVAHNIDLAARLDGLKAGDSVSLYGEYVWSDQGGLVHWTHRDPGGQHAAGYIEWQGRRYQ
jgi:Protein of unknown function (DUF3465)